jgi:tetratricopeptide (TPR) repeat protein
LRLIDPVTSKTLFTTLVEQDRSEADFSLPMDAVQTMYRILDATDWNSLDDRNTDPGMQNQDAREVLLAGQSLMQERTIEQLDRAIALLQKAAQLAPNSVLAHASLSAAATTRTHYFADWKYLDIGLAEAKTAVALGPESGEAHRALAACYYQQGRFAEAAEEGLRTLETAGIDQKSVGFLSMAFDTLGQTDKALQWLALASKLAGTRADMGTAIGDCWVKLGDDERALAAYRRSMDLQPKRIEAAVVMCRLYMLKQDFVSARNLYQQHIAGKNDLGNGKAIRAQIELFARNFEEAKTLYAALTEADPLGGGAFYGAVSYGSALGRAKQALGDPMAKEILESCLAEERKAVARQPQNAEAVYRLAAVESCLDHTSDAISHLRKAVDLGWTDFRSLSLDPRFDSLRGNEQFESVIRKLAHNAASVRQKILARNNGREDNDITELGRIE